MPSPINVILGTNGKWQVLPDKPLPRNKTGKQWIHVSAENEDQLKLLFLKHNIHPLTIEDILNPNSRIKLEVFPSYVFFIFRGFHFDKIRLTPRNFNFILTENQIITVTIDFRNTIYDMIEDWKSNQTLLSQGYEFIIHKILDVETDHTLGIALRIEERIEHFEEQIFLNSSSLDISTVYVLRGSLQHIKKGIHQNKEMLDQLDRVKREFFGKEADAFFRDVEDHFLKILDLVDNNIESISSALEAHLALSSRRTNEIMKILTIMTAVMLPMSLVTGIYGMNFEYIPILNWKYGYHITLGVMTAIGVGMIAYFRLKRWI